MRESVKSRLWVANWIRSLGGKEPEFRILETTSREEAGVREIEWIRRLREQGCRLTNLTDGGEGQLGLSPSSETRKKIGACHKGKVVSEETRKKLSEAARKRTLSQRQAQTDRLRAYQVTTEDRRKMSGSQRQRYLDPAALEKQKEILQRARAVRWARHKESKQCLSQTQI